MEQQSYYQNPQWEKNYEKQVTKWLVSRKTLEPKKKTSKECEQNTNIFVSKNIPENSDENYFTGKVMLQ